MKLLHADVQKIADQLLRLDEVAERIGMSRPTVYRMIADGRLPFIATAYGMRVWTGDLKDLIENRHQ